MHAGGQGFESPRLHQPNAASVSAADTGQSLAIEEGGLAGAVDAFLLSRRVANCSARTLDIYRTNLDRFQRSAGGIDALSVQRYLNGLKERGLKPSSVHQHFRSLRAFFRWWAEVGLSSVDPTRGLDVRVPKTLPRVPDDGEVAALLRHCPDTFEGLRNRVLVLLLADSALRVSEATRLRIEDVHFATRTLSVRGGKGGADGTAFFGTETAHAVRRWLARRINAHPRTT